MIVPVARYNEILRECRLLVESFRLPTIEFCEQCQLDFDALTSISNQLYIRQTKKLLPFIEQDLQRIAQVSVLCFLMI
jgi:hypothetical protein